MELGRIFLERSRHYLATEYRTKLRRAVESLPADALWWRPNDQANRVGNRLVHLAGNVRQWIVAGVGAAATLLADLEAALGEADRVLASLDAASLGRHRTVQGRELTILEAVYHVVEHFSLHLGQIIYLAKLHTPGAVRFYDDAGGVARPLWPAMVEPLHPTVPGGERR